MKLKALITATAIAFSTATISAQAQSPADLNDPQIAHVAYMADNIDIRYAHLALALSKNAEIRTFAKTMIRDHEAVNDQALALLKKLKAKPQDNFLSKFLLKLANMESLSGHWEIQSS